MAKKFTKKRETDIHKTQLLIWGIPKELKARFKGCCSLNNTSMKIVIIELMKDYINAN